MTNAIPFRRVAMLSVAILLLLAGASAAAVALQGWQADQSAGGSGGDDIVRGEPGVLLVSTGGGLVEGLPERIAARDDVDAISLLFTNKVELAASWQGDVRVDEPTPGFVIPLDAIAFDPSSFASVAPDGDHPSVTSLAPGEALLSRTGADVRGLEAGAVLELASGQRATVAGVVPDEVIAHAEIAFPVADSERMGVTDPRGFLVAHQNREAVEDALRRIVPPDRGVRAVAPGELPFYRLGGTVLPQALIKQRFGEFSYRPRPHGRVFEQDPAWVATNIVTTQAPLVGEIKCHREIVPRVLDALAEVERLGLAHTIDPSDYAGCWGPRLMSVGGSVSRHAWGIAIDFNATTNGMGDPPRLDGRVVEVFEARGFAWGGRWLVPDGMHFEHISE